MGTGYLLKGLLWPEVWVRWTGLLVLLMGGSACSDPLAQHADVAIQFREPVRYPIQSGDTLASIAKDHGVTVADLENWNELSSDAIEAGDVLLLWKVPKEQLPDPTLLVDARPSDTKRRRLGGRPTASQTRSAGRGSSRPAPRDDSDDGRPRSVTQSGLFSSEFGGMDDDGLADAVAGLERSERTDVGGRRRTADMRAMSTEKSGDIDRRVVEHRTGPYFPSKAVRTPRLARPGAKRCKTQRARGTGENGMYAGDGLSSSQIKSSLGRTLGTTRRCMPSGTQGSFTVIVELNVGCDGRVKNAYTIASGGAPSSVTQCIETVLGYTSFPAHDIPDGQSFQYPINYTF